ncbi:MAG: tRNA (guanosine(46)-N7)-methyltransferase TrmB [Gammaproteobacteria bacterium]|nr:tRNA (guanosine(46)-N7)-methyltransferase TrmB [Gammaproteobacteria bacterium]
MSEPDKLHHRRIRSFVRREGRLTRGQESALEELFPSIGIRLEQGMLDLGVLFGRPASSQTCRILEIGFGNGASLVQMAQTHPENDYLGIEVHRPGAGNLLLQMEEKRLANIRISTDDALDVMRVQIPDNSLDAVYLFFPDPWHKQRHHKRRIVQNDFVQLVRQKLKPGGLFHLATDWENYARQMMKVLSTAEGFENTAGEQQYSERPAYRPLTKFEQRGQRLGHGVWDLVFKCTLI